MESVTAWSSQQLAEFVASVSVYTEESAALRGTVERASEAFEAEAVAIVWSGAVVASVGFPADRVPEAHLVAAAARHQDTVEVPGIGLCQVVTAPLDVSGHDAAVVLARSGSGFSREEVSLLRAMNRVVSLTINNLRVVASLRERQTLLEKLAEIERLISTRAPMDEILDAITKGVSEIMGDEIAALYLIDRDDPSLLTMVAAAGLDALVTPRLTSGHVGRGASGRSMAENELVVIESYTSSPHATAKAIALNVHATVAAPVHEHGQVIGSLAVASKVPGRTFSQNECDVLKSFAEHASMAVSDARTVAALHEAADDALHKALHDPLTGLSNRTRFLDRLDHALSVRHQPGVEVAVLYIDVDDFKLVNDRFGHGAGDGLLVEAAERVVGAVRSGDTVARLGGDEFAVLLENTGGIGDAQRGATRILDAFRAPFVLGHTDLSVNASIGIALASTAGISSDEVLRNADVAMYRAKNSGKGCAVVFEAGMYESLLERIEMEAELRRAIDRDEIEVYFQPIVDLATEDVVGVEALARWWHPTRGFIPPSTFIPVAEETGIIVTLGRQVLLRACSWVGSWQQRHPDASPLSLSVNVSARQLQHPDLATDVAQALMTGGLNPGSLVLEITESVLIQDTEWALARLQELKDIGVQLALDDFGTGYSSLSYLRRFPVDLLKIDRSFVSALSTGEEVPLIIEAIIALGDALGLKSVAEGIEELDELAALRSVGCRFGQGFHFARPMPADDLELFLESSCRRAASAGRELAVNPLSES